MNITLLEIKQICVSIVRSWPHGSDGRLNTFSMIDKKTDYSKDNFGKSHQSYLDYDYWVRGYSQDNDLRLPGFLTLEYRDTDIENIERDDLVYDLWFTVAGERDSDRSRVARSPRSIFDLEVKVLRLFLKEFMAFSKYEVTSGAETFMIWANENDINNISAANSYTNVSHQMESVRNMIAPTKETKIFEQYNLSAYGFIGATKRVGIKVCDSIVRPNFDYTVKDAHRAGVIICC